MATTCEPVNAALIVPAKVGVMSSVLVPEATATAVVVLPTEPLVFRLSVMPVMVAVCVGTAASMTMALLVADTTLPAVPVVLIFPPCQTKPAFPEVV
mgnify:CR=1 FL=1